MLYDELLNQSNDILSYFGGLKGTSTGLAPETTSALRTQAMESIPAQFAQTERDLTTSLLRRGGGLPMGGEFLRTYAPLQSDKIQAQSNLLRDITLADQAERSRTLDRNNDLALSAGGQMSGLGTALRGQAQNQQQFESSQDFARGQNALDREHQLQLAEINNAPASFKSLLLSSLLSSAFAPNQALGGNSILGTGIGSLIDILGGGNDSGGGGIVPQIAGSVGDIIGDAAKTLPTSPLPGPDITETAAGGGGLLGALGSIGNEIGTLGGLVPLSAGIPIVGGAIAGGVALAKKLWGNGPDRMAANQLTGAGGIHEHVTNAINGIIASGVGGEEKAEAEAQLAREVEQYLVDFSKQSKDHYYQAQRTLRDFSWFGVKPLLG